MENLLVSIIIPVYNVSPFLKRCLDSVINQSYKNLEIILIDDGSIDDSSKICDDFAATDNRIKVVHKANGGLSSARNAGIAIAKGLYLSFVDGDDVIHPDFIQHLYEAVALTEKKMAVCLFDHFSDSKPLCFNVSKKDFLRMTVKEAMSFYCELTPARSTAFISCCTKLYHRSLFNEVRFPEGKIYEDGLVSYKLIDIADGVAFVEEPLYGYYMRSDSIMGIKEKHPYQSVLAPYKESIAYFENAGKNDIASLFYPPMLMRELYRYWVAKEVSCDKVAAEEIFSLYRKDCKTLHEVNCSIKKKLIFQMLAKCPWIYGLYRKVAPGLVGGR